MQAYFIFLVMMRIGSRFECTRGVGRPFGWSAAAGHFPLGAAPIHMTRRRNAQSLVRITVCGRQCQNGSRSREHARKGYLSRSGARVVRNDIGNPSNEGRSGILVSPPKLRFMPCRSRLQAAVDNFGWTAGDVIALRVLCVKKLVAAHRARELQLCGNTKQNAKKEAAN